MARSSRPVHAARHGDGVEEPALRSVPPGAATAAPQAVDVAGRDVWLIHPWALGEPPRDLPQNCLRLGLWPKEHHVAWPWSPARWAFVGTRMAALAALHWHAGRQALAQALAGARSVQTLADPHVSALLPPQVVQRAPPLLFANVDRSCASFSTWCVRTTRGVQALPDLPGLAALAALGSAGPLFESAHGPFTDPTSNESFS